MKALVVWMNGERVGTWVSQRDSHAFEYDKSWAGSSRARSLSLSLPMAAGSIKGPQVTHYFDNLLPDNEKIRERIMRRHKTDSTDVIDLLEAIGRDCVGAVQLLPVGAEPEGWDRVAADPLDEDDIARIIDDVTSDAPLDDDDSTPFRISMAGAQEKTALLHWKGRWCRPLGSTPTTHIVKLPLGLIGGSRRVDARDSVENEWLCSRILASFGLPVAEAQIQTFGVYKVLLVKRFDREVMAKGRWIARLPQEDFCQVYGLPPEKKYEQDGGPGMTQCLDVLRTSRNPQDANLFLQTQLVFWLLAATDGHAKNFSIFLNQGDSIELTPLYDVLSMWPYFGNAPSQFSARKASLAMGLKSKTKHYRLHTITARHWQGLALANGGSEAWKRMLELVASVDAVLARVETELPSAFPPRTWERISEGTRALASLFMQEAARLPPLKLHA